MIVVGLLWLVCYRWWVLVRVLGGVMVGEVIEWANDGLKV